MFLLHGDIAQKDVVGYPWTGWQNQVFVGPHIVLRQLLLFDFRHYPVLDVLVFLPRIFLDFWHFLQRSWQLFLAKFARIFKSFQDRGKKSKKFFGLLGKKTKTIQNLGKRTIKSLHQNNTRSIDILLAIIIENSKKGLLLRVLLSEPQLSLIKNNEAKINWNKMEAKMKQIGTKTMVQTSSVKTCDFSDLFRVYKWIDFALEKFVSKLPPPSARNPDPTKLHSPNSFSPKMLLTFQSRLLAFKRWLKSLKQKKNEQVERSEKLFFPLLEVLSNCSKN